MQNIKNHLKGVFESFDIFGQPIQFSLNRKYLEKSSFGSLMTIALIAIFVSIAFDGFLALIYHTNMTAYTQETNYRSPPSIDFKSRQFTFAITFNNLTLNDPRYFDLEVSQTIEISNKKGAKDKDKREIQMEKCSSDHFPPEILDDLLKKTSNINNLLCPSKNLEIYVEGAYSSPKFSYFSIKLSKCKSNKNKTCVPENEVDSIFAELGRVYLNVYFINNIINSNDFETPVVSFLDDRIYVLIDRNTYKEKNFFFEENKVFTDTSISTTSFQEDINTYTYENIYDETIVNHKGPDDDVYAGIYFRSYLLGQQHMRKFEKIWDYMGQIGGFWSLLYLLFSIVAKKYNKFKLLMKIANSLYEFPDLKHIPNLGNKTMRNLTLKINAKTKEIDKDPFSSRMASYIKESKTPKLPFSFYSFLRGKIYHILHSFVNASKRNILAKIEKVRNIASLEIQKDTDIVYLLKKVKEIDKIRDILFDNFQKEIFNYSTKKKLESVIKSTISRASFQFFKKSNTMRFTDRVENGVGNFDLYYLYQCFCEVQSYSSDNHNGESRFLSEFNRRILKCFDQNLLETFKRFYEENHVKNK